MSSSKRTIRRNDARVLLSEVLPYELPPTFSNRGFYDLVNALGLKRVEGTWTVRTSSPAAALVLSAIFGEPIEIGNSPRADGSYDLTMTVRPNPYAQTVPFHFAVRHRGTSSRALSIMHPRSQLEVASFYQEHADIMLYHSSQSSFSLRRPARRARYSVVRDWLFERSGVQAIPDGRVELDSRDYDWVRSYFTYSRYSNVFKFYDSAEYRRCERRYSYLVKADITKCFDSIYTHSITWATHGKELVKSDIKASNKTFAGAFDQLMQALNHDETSGILIGPETSRIFAEIILQAVDRDVEDELSLAGLVHQRDYEILRYVDDYFIFLSDSRNRGLILRVIADKLRPFKLHLNDSKEEGEHTPWMSPLTVAKDRVRRAIKKAVKLPKIPEPNSAQSGSKLPGARVRLQRLVLAYKEVLIDTGAGHRDLANFTLAKVERSIEKVVLSSRLAVETVHMGTPPLEVESHFSETTSALLALLDFSFFVYSGSPRVSPGIKIARIVSTSSRFARTPGLRATDRERLERKVAKEIITQLRRRSESEQPGVETCTLIDCLTDLGPTYRLTEPDLAESFGVQLLQRAETVPDQFNALQLFSILAHIGLSPEYTALHTCLEVWVRGQLEKPSKDSQRSILILNLVDCPFISDQLRLELLSGIEPGASVHASSVRSFLKKVNVDWSGFDLYSSLQQKRLYEVY